MRDGNTLGCASESTNAFALEAEGMPIPPLAPTPRHLHRDLMQVVKARRQKGSDPRQTPEQNGPSCFHYPLCRVSTPVLHRQEQASSAPPPTTHRASGGR